MTHTVTGAAKTRAPKITALNKPYRWQLPPGARDTLDYISGLLADEANSGRLRSPTHARYLAARAQGALTAVLARADLTGRDYGRLFRIEADLFSLLFYNADMVDAAELVDHVLMLSGLLCDARTPRPAGSEWRWTRDRFRQPASFIPAALLRCRGSFVA